MTAGTDLKRRGIARANSNPESAPWRARAGIALRKLARSGEPFTSEDVTAEAGQPPSSAAVGAMMNAASRAGWITREGFDKAVRPNQHSALISVWSGVRDKVPAEPYDQAMSFDAEGTLMNEELIVAGELVPPDDKPADAMPDPIDSWTEQTTLW